MAEKIEALKAMVEGFEKAKEKAQIKSDQYFWEALINYYRRVISAKEEGKPLAMVGLFTPSELYQAMDIAYLAAEYHGILSATGSKDGLVQFYDIAEGYGLSNEVCSPHRMAVGLAKAGMVPEPDFLVSTATTCDQTLKLYEILAHMFQRPAFLIDSPYKNDQRAIEYTKAEIKNLIGFLEEQTKKKLDYDRLNEVLRLSKDAYDYWEKICLLRKAVPCPIGSRDTIKDFGVLLTASGRLEAVKYFEARYKEIKERVDSKKGIIPEEKYRISWLYVLPMFDLGIANWMEEKYKAVIVMDTFSWASSHIELNPSDPLEFLAKKPLKWAFVELTYGANEATKFSKLVAEQCVEYRIDIAMLLAHWSCSQYCGIIKLLKDEIVKKTGIPFLIIDGDLLDPRVVSSAQMRAKIDELFETMEARDDRRIPLHIPEPA